jgi:hypothetical protein
MKDVRKSNSEWASAVLPTPSEAIERDPFAASPALYSLLGGNRHERPDDGHIARESSYNHSG